MAAASSVMSSAAPPTIRDAVRIKVIQHSETEVDSQCCRFSVDPELTGYEVLRNLIARAFDLKRDYQTCYLARDDRFSQACWVPLLSDFDLEMAFIKSADPYLLVRVDLVSSSSNGSWEAVTSTMDIPKLSLPDLPKNNYSAKLPGLFKEKMEKTLSAVQKVLSWNEDGEESACRPSRPPLTDSGFQQMLNGVGQLAHPKELRLCVYLGGLEPSLRKVVWKHLLNVYPEGLTGRERLDYMKQKTKEYEGLKSIWQEHLLNEQVVSEDVKYVTNMVRKDVLRTDRHHPYFSGPDDNANIQSLSNILTTYALNHPSIGYCQGMSDLASPLLVTMRDEAQAYVCFCALMARVHSNFHIDGVAMTLKFQHLTEALIFYDEEYYAYLRLHQADDLLFCYRWLLLELKREFAFDDALHMLEVLWSSLPPDPPKETLSLLEQPFNPVKEETLVAPQTPRQNHFANVCALRRQRSSVSNRSAECLAAILSRRAVSMECDGPTEAPGGARKLSRTWSQPIDASQVRARVPSGGESAAVTVERIREETSSPEDSPSRSTRKIKNLREFQLLTKNRDSDSDSNPGSPLRDKRNREASTNKATSPNNTLKSKSSSRRCFSDSDAADVGVPLYCDGGEVDVWQNPVATLSPEVDQHLQIICQEEDRPRDTIQQQEKAPSSSSEECKQAEDQQGTMTASVNSCEEVTEVTGWQVAMSGDGSAPHVNSLLPPEEFGGGNPFLMFLCVTLLLQHRNHIIKNKMDHNELAMYFDKMVRQHNVTKVLSHARRMFENYLKFDFSKARSKSSPPSTSSNDHSC